MVNLTRVVAHVALAQPAGVPKNRARSDNHCEWTLVEPGAYFSMVPPSVGVFRSKTVVQADGSKVLRKTMDIAVPHDLEEAVTEHSTFSAYTTTLTPMEALAVRLLAPHKPHISYQEKCAPEENPKELCPDGFKAIWAKAHAHPYECM